MISSNRVNRGKFTFLVETVINPVVLMINVSFPSIYFIINNILEIERKSSLLLWMLIIILLVLEVLSAMLSCIMQ